MAQLRKGTEVALLAVFGLIAVQAWNRTLPGTTITDTVSWLVIVGFGVMFVLRLLVRRGEHARRSFLEVGETDLPQQVEDLESENDGDDEAEGDDDADIEDGESE